MSRTLKPSVGAVTSAAALLLLSFAAASYAGRPSFAGRQGTPVRNASPLGGIRPLSQLDKIKQANAAVLRSGIKRTFTKATTVMTWGFNAVNNSNHGSLKVGPGIDAVDFMAKTVAIQATDLTQYPRPITLDVSVYKGSFYMVDVYCTPSTSSLFKARSNRTTSGGNFPAEYSMTMSTDRRHFVFVMQTALPYDGQKNTYRIELGADQPWTFEKIELTKVE